MGVIEYFRIVGRYWWLLLLAIVATVGGTVAYDQWRYPTYSGTASVVLLPSSEGLSSQNVDSRTVVDLIGGIGSRTVLGTYAQAFTTRQVINAASSAVRISTDDARNYPLQANPLPDTAVIEISGTGPDPTILREYMDATISEVLSNTRTLYGVVQLQSLEPAYVPPQPSSPQPLRDALLAVAIGLLLGIILAVLLYYLRTNSVEQMRSSYSVVTDVAAPEGPLPRQNLQPQSSTGHDTAPLSRSPLD